MYRLPGMVCRCQTVRAQCRCHRGQDQKSYQGRLQCIFVPDTLNVPGTLAEAARYADCGYPAAQSALLIVGCLLSNDFIDDLAVVDACGLRCRGQELLERDEFALAFLV